jgi:hypothetical protein
MVDSQEGLSSMERVGDRKLTSSARKKFDRERYLSQNDPKNK